MTNKKFENDWCNSCRPQRWPGSCNVVVRFRTSWYDGVAGTVTCAAQEAGYGQWSCGKFVSIALLKM